MVGTRLGADYVAPSKKRTHENEIKRERERELNRNSKDILSNQIPGSGVCGIGL
jgi:hypothetical protein